jgi:hypothetical protein
MHMQNPVPSEVISQMLAHSHHSLELPPIDHRRIRKSPLRPIHPNRLSTEGRLMPLRPSMNLIPLWHPALSSKTENNGDGIYRRHRQETNLIPNQKN